jgi:iron complex transport system substrate-binding protein
MTGQPPARRIVSLLASATETVALLGLGDRLVAISHECDYPPELMDRPRASRTRFDTDQMASGDIDRAVREAMAAHGSVYAIDEQLLRQLQPDLILTQDLCEVCAVPLAGVHEVVEACGIGATVLALDAHTIEDILGSIIDVGTAAGVPERARAAVDDLRRRLLQVEAAVNGAARPSVLGVEWFDPLFSPGHWVPEMIERAGGVNLLGTPGGRSIQTDWDAVGSLDPDVLVVMPCGYGLQQSMEEADRFADRLLAIAPRAIAAGRAWVVDGSSYFNRSGPRAIDGVEILAGLLHPDRWSAPAPQAAMAWQPPRR